ncbi:nitroreductase family protein [Acidaminobacter sp.]|uniref:nitroreductase family protein n=1 Tax=Acidaminobacter sp. TaxID=1872102 RepID=UPI001382E3EA|nr:nitroreductase family protein [Acidaminobacter sp.]MDK9710175.1 nitroreductase family protein [Acidaminobacter sp.]MZQ98739.1 nitroreductase family protein [Acidaminobacter sp.]
MNDVIKALYERKSVRRFLPDQLKDEDILAVIEAGNQAPSGHNTQPVRFTILQDQALIDHINDATKNVMRDSEVDWIRKFGASERYHLLHKAPTVVIVSVRSDVYSPVADASAAVENMLVAAHSLGIGSVWVGLISSYFQLPEAYGKLKIRDGYKPLYAVCLGYEDPKKVLPKPSRQKDVFDWIR